MKRQGLLSLKTSLDSSVGSLMWKGDGLFHSSLKLISENGVQRLAILEGLMSISSKDMGSIELEGQAAIGGELIVEVVLSALGC